MKNKGQATSLSDVLIGLLVVGLIGLFVFLFITRGQEVQVRVEQNEILRRKITLMNVLLSSEELIYTTETMVHRGVIDKEKLDDIESNPESLSRISYSDSGYSLKVIDLDVNEEWLVGNDFDPIFEAPVAIRYSEDDIHMGIISVEFTSELPMDVKELDTCQRITESGYYKLTRNLNEDDLLGGDAFGSKDCFVITTSGVTLDCQNRFSITGMGSHRGIGVVINNPDSIVKNCEIRDFNTGIEIDSRLNKIEDNHIETCNLGIIVFKNENEIEGNIITEPEGDLGRGIDVHSESNLIEDNKIFDTIKNGVIIRKDGNELIDNVVCGSQMKDIFVDDGKTATGSGNTCDETNNYDDEGTTGCEKSCDEENSGTCYQGDVKVEIRATEEEIKEDYPTLPDYLLWGIAMQESGASHCRGYEVVEGPLGSTGIMQIYPTTASSYCTDLDLTDWKDNIECGGRVLIGKYNAYRDEDETYDPLDCGYSYADPWMRAVRGYNGWGCPIEWPSTRRYVCLVYDHAREENPSLPIPECP